MQNQYNIVSHCKVNGTERSIMTALSQSLRLVSNPVTTGKVPEFLFAACRVNKFNLNIVDFTAVMAKLKTVEMMYGIELHVAVATVFEMQHKLKFPELNDVYIHVKSNHPSDSDDVALKRYHFLWATTKAFEVTRNTSESIPESTRHTQESTPDATHKVLQVERENVLPASNTNKEPNTPTNTSTNTSTGTSSNITTDTTTDTTDSTYDSSSENEEVSKTTLKEAGKTLGKKTVFDKK